MISNALEKKKKKRPRVSEKLRHWAWRGRQPAKIITEKKQEPRFPVTALNSSHSSKGEKRILLLLKITKAAAVSSSYLAKKKKKKSFIFRKKRKASFQLLICLCDKAKALNQRDPFFSCYLSNYFVPLLTQSISFPMASLFYTKTNHCILPTVFNSLKPQFAVLLLCVSIFTVKFVAAIVILAVIDSRWLVPAGPKATGDLRARCLGRWLGLRQWWSICPMRILPSIVNLSRLLCRLSLPFFG